MKYINKIIFLLINDPLNINETTKKGEKIEKIQIYLIKF
jgi:hypothetical protein